MALLYLCLRGRVFSFGGSGHHVQRYQELDKQFNFQTTCFTGPTKSREKC